MALHSRYAVTVSAAVATRSRADCSSMEDRRGNKRPYQPKHSPIWVSSVKHSVHQKLFYVGKFSINLIVFKLVLTALETVHVLHYSVSCKVIQIL